MQHNTEGPSSSFKILEIIQAQSIPLTTTFYATTDLGKWGELD